MIRGCDAYIFPVLIFRLLIRTCRTSMRRQQWQCFSNELLNCFERLWAKYVCENRLWRYFYLVDVALLLYREYTSLDDKDILFLNAEPVENVLHLVCTEGVHIVLRNDHSSLNDLVMTLEIRYVSIQELQLDLRCYTRSSWKYSQFAVSKCISTKISAETHFEHVAALDLIMSGESQIIRVCDRCLSRSGEKSLKDLFILTSRLWHYSYSVVRVLTYANNPCRFAKL